MIKFISSTIPRDIDIRFFWDKEVAFYEARGEEDFSEYIYLYNGSMDKAIPFLSSIGFSDINIIEEVDYTSGYFLVRRTATK
jgi:hypothetical protein